MEQMHKRFTAEQVRALLKGYHQGTLDRAAIEEILGVSKTRFFALLREYRQNPGEFSLTYQRATPTRLPASAEKEIERELMLEKGLIEDPSLPISGYNYAAIRDRLAKHGVWYHRLLSLPWLKTLAVTSLIPGRRPTIVRSLPPPSAP